MLDKLNSGKIIIFWKKEESKLSGQDHNNATTNNIKIVDFIELCMNSNVIRKIKWSCSGNATMSKHSPHEAQKSNGLAELHDCSIFWVSSLIVLDAFYSFNTFTLISKAVPSMFSVRRQSGDLFP